MLNLNIKEGKTSFFTGVCSNGFEQHEEKCYLFKGNTRQPWSTAKLFCEKFDSNLLEIESYVFNNDNVCI